MKSLALAAAFLVLTARPAAAVDAATPAVEDPDQPKPPAEDPPAPRSEPIRNNRGEVVSPEIQAEVDRNVANRTVNFDGTDKPIGEVLERIAPEDRALAEKIIAAGRTPIFDSEGNFLGSNDPTNQMSILGSAERESFAKELAAAGVPQNPAPVTAADAANQAAVAGVQAAAAANAALGGVAGVVAGVQAAAAANAALGAQGGGRVPREGDADFIGPVRPPPGSEDPGAAPPTPTGNTETDVNNTATWLMAQNDPNNTDGRSDSDSGLGERDTGPASNNPVTGAGTRSDDGQNNRVGGGNSGGSEIKCQTRGDCQAVAQSIADTQKGIANGNAFDAPRDPNVRSVAGLSSGGWADALSGKIGQIGGALGELLGIKSRSESAVANVTGDNATGTVLHDGGDTGFDGQGASRAAVDNPPLCEGKDFCWNNKGRTVLPPS